MEQRREGKNGNGSLCYLVDPLSHLLLSATLSFFRARSGTIEMIWKFCLTNRKMSNSHEGRLLPILKLFFILKAKLRPTFTEVGTGSRSECENPMPGWWEGGKRSEIFVCTRKEEIVNLKLISSFCFWASPFSITSSLMESPLLKTLNRKVKDCSCCSVYR